MPLKPIKIYDHGPSPNPWKVVILLEELGLPYTREHVDFAVIKKEPFISVNPNGRVPAIEDPNTGLTLWESGAIVEYLVETYDKENKISFERGSADYFLAKQWLHFQVSGQGPYFGQAVWFTHQHPEKIESATKRYIKEIRRVSGVLDKFLQDKQYLVGEKFSYADLSFIPWYLIMDWFKIDLAKEFPKLNAWLERQHTRPTIATVIERRSKEPFE
ncbi:Uncharacterized protein PECH_001593 [Penicillium ucsense]|uniref:glutathione transferase n=1 Tax=Penicillium ucsense TaxID=2839758 RepID=A0A8J8WFE8_9EURO|nr:Uncharacterized protein PECM_001404 [Penicillium ucsense]KAF7732620.1 Uncharacterized protein PECH_001593 [Penicillium ucsense]